MYMFSLCFSSFCDPFSFICTALRSLLLFFAKGLTCMRFGYFCGVLNINSFE